MPRRQTFWAALSAVMGGLAAVVTAITGLYLALRSSLAPSAGPSVASMAPALPGGAAAELEGTTYERTPWLGIELRQNERLVRLRSINDAWDRFEATVGSGPFELNITRRADDASIGILAWHDESVFQFIRNGELRLPGTGIAGGQFAVPILYLNKEGFNYYDTDRMKRVNDSLYSIFISTIGSGEVELPLARFNGPLYLVIFRVPNDMTVRSHDFELITLRR